MITRKDIEKRPYEVNNERANQRMREKERIYSDNGSFISQRQNNERLRSHRLSTSQLKDYDNSSTRSQNASISIDKAKNYQQIEVLSPYPPQAQIKPLTSHS